MKKRPQNILMQGRKMIRLLFRSCSRLGLTPQMKPKLSLLRSTQASSGLSTGCWSRDSVVIFWSLTKSCQACRLLSLTPPSTFTTMWKGLFLITRKTEPMWRLIMRRPTSHRKFFLLPKSLKLLLWWMKIMRFFNNSASSLFFIWFKGQNRPKSI